MSPTTGPARVLQSFQSLQCFIVEKTKTKQQLILLLAGSSSNLVTVNILPVVLTVIIIAHGQQATGQRCDSPRSWTMPPPLKSMQRQSAGFPLVAGLQGLSHRAEEALQTRWPAAAAAFFFFCGRHCSPRCRACWEP